MKEPNPYAASATAESGTHVAHVVGRPAFWIIAVVIALLHFSAFVLGEFASLEGGLASGKVLRQIFSVPFPGFYYINAPMWGLAISYLIVLAFTRRKQVKP